MITTYYAQTTTRVVPSLTFNPQNFNQSFLTTDTQGLWMSINMNATTPSWNLVSSYIFRQPGRVFFNPYNQNEVWVTCFGNGIKKGSMLSTGIKYFNTDKNIIFTAKINGELIPKKYFGLIYTK